MLDQEHSVYIRTYSFSSFRSALSLCLDMWEPVDRCVHTDHLKTTLIDFRGSLVGSHILWYWRAGCWTTLDHVGASEVDVCGACGLRVCGTLVLSSCMKSCFVFYTKRHSRILRTWVSVIQMTWGNLTYTRFVFWQTQRVRNEMKWIKRRRRKQISRLTNAILVSVESCGVSWLPQSFEHETITTNSSSYPFHALM